jgi:ribosome-binding protein aMBF1 (putative translation factor)
MNQLMNECGKTMCCSRDCLDCYPVKTSLIHQTPPESLGKTIETNRKKLNLSQEELAVKIGIQRAAVCHYELNRREPDIQMLIKLADMFGITVDQLVRPLYKGASA